MSQDIMVAFAPCRRVDCSCEASWNGAYGEYCCVECRDGQACRENAHKFPVRPVKQPQGKKHRLYHGTTMARLQSIRANGFWPSSKDELLGAGVYFVEEA